MSFFGGVEVVTVFNYTSSHSGSVKNAGVSPYLFNHRTMFL